MKKRGFVFISLLSLGVLAGILFISNSGENQKFEPKIEKSRKATSIKGAIEYYHSIRADLSSGQIDMQAYNKVRNQLKGSNYYRANGLNLQWDQLGPDNQGGRTRAFLIDKDNPNILYAGSASGGVFISKNGGKSWEAMNIDANLGGLVISCIDQGSDGSLYFGTGERYFTYMSGTGGNLTSGSFGGGVYKFNTDNETWELLPKTDATQSGQTNFQNIQDIVVDPNNPSTVFAATYSGLMKSTDAGATWNRVTLPSLGGTSFTTRVITELEYASDGTLWGSAWNASQNDYSRTLIFKSSDGSTFEDIGKKLSSSMYFSRVTLGIAPTNPNVVYAVTADPGYAMGGIFKTTDGGNTWNTMVPSGTQAEIFGRSGHYQGQYDNCVAVDPNDENRIFVGGVDLYCLDGTFWYKAASTTEWNDLDHMYKNPYYVHADKHLIIFDTKSSPQRMYVTTDGGIAVSTDFSAKYPTYSTININYITTQFYAIDVSLRGDMVGGTQDNGSLRFDYNGFTGKSVDEVWGGDGFYSAISQIDPNIYFFESQYGNIGRSKTKGDDPESFGTELGISEVSPNFNTPFRLWEKMVTDTYYFDTLGIKHDTALAVSKFFVLIYDNTNAKAGLWMTPHATNFAADSVKWFHLTTGLAGFTPRALEYSKDGNTVFLAGTHGSQGVIYRVTGLGKYNFELLDPATFDADASGIETKLIGSFNSRAACGIGVHPYNDNIVAVALGSYVSASFDHVYLTTNAMDTTVSFASIQGTNSNALPGFPVYDIAFNSNTPNDYSQIIVASEYGMWGTDDGGRNWYNENHGLNPGPVFMIRQLKRWDEQDGWKFYIATHGQGIYSTSSLSSIKEEDNNEIVESTKLGIYPNPASVETNISFELKNYHKLTAEIISLSGKVVMRKDLSNVAKEGMNKISLNVNSLPRGSYFVRVYGENIQLTNKFIKL